jgi:hypothetical protein
MIWADLMAYSLLCEQNTAVDRLVLIFPTHQPLFPSCIYGEELFISANRTQTADCLNPQYGWLVHTLYGSPNAAKM